MAGSDDDRQGGGRRPAPRRPGRPQPAQQADDDEATQALNLADFDFGDEDEGAHDETVSMSPAQLRAQASARPDIDADDADEATVAMQIPAELLAEDNGLTLQGHPGAAAAVRGALAAGESGRRNKTMAMGSRVPQAVAAAAAAAEDDDEATMAMNVDAMLAQIDAGDSGASEAEPDEDEDERTMAVNMDDMLAEIDDGGGAAEGANDEATVAMNLDAMMSQIDDDDDDDDDEKTIAMSIETATARAGASKPVRAKAAAAAAQAPAAAKKATPVAVGASGGLSAEGFFGAVGYALAFDGRQHQLAEGISDADAALEAGDGDAGEIRQRRQRYVSEQGAMDAAEAQRGWILFGGLVGAPALLLLLLGLIL